MADRDIENEALVTTVAKLEIEYLQRHYALATDLIGLNTEESIARGRAIYRRVFTPDVKIRATEKGELVFAAVGPEAWLDVAAGALSVFDKTQHLVGTQIV
ncbi:MAG: hypothetical protein GTO41_25890, partial [Burkholderiales bacterium]|nr:hypothetical protein [Burkholderiales bacterium]